MAITTYATLQTAIASTLNRTDLTSAIPDWISFCESRMRDDLDHRLSETEATLTMTASGKTVSLPSDFNSPIGLVLETNPATTMVPGTMYQLRQQYPSSGAGRPRLFTVFNNEIHYRPPADDDYTATLYYYQDLPALTDSNTSNWMLAAYPSAYLYGSLVFSAPHIRADSRIGVWEGIYRDVMQGIQKSDDRAKTNATPARTKPDVLRTP